MRFGIRKKIILSFPIVMLLGALIWVLSYHSHALLNRKIQACYQKNNLFNTVLEARRYEKNYLLSLDARNLRKALHYVLQGEDMVLQLASQQEKEEFFDFRLADLQAYEKLLTDLVMLHKEQGSVGLDPSARIEDLSFKVHMVGRQLTLFLEENVDKEQHDLQALLGKSRSYHLTTLTALFLLALGVILYWFFNVDRPLRAIQGGIDKIARGDYRRMPKVPAGDLFEYLVTALDNMISELHKRNEQLVQTEKMAALGTLTSGVAHELNNPLNNVATSIQILLEELDAPDPDFQRGLLREAETELDRARDTVKGLLDFSKERSCNPQSVNFGELVEKTVKLLRKKEIPPCLAVEIDIPENLRAAVDPRKIQHVLINLIQNGVDAMSGQGGGRFTIRTAPPAKAGFFCLQVEDNGEGITPENLNRIFDPFFTTKPQEQGTGLGLSISHGIVAQHGGRIEVASTPGKGTIFSIHLPLCQKQEPGPG